MAYQDNNNGLPLDDVFGWLWLESTGFGTAKTFERIPLEIAQKNARLTPGQDLIFNSADKTLLNKLNTWKRRNNLMEKLRNSEFIASLYGKTIMFVVPDKTGDNPNLVVMKNNYMGRVAKVNDEEQYAELWTQDSQGDYILYKKISITPDTITVENFTANRAQVSETGGDIQDQLTLKDKVVYKNPFGTLPVVEIQNLTINNVWGQTVLNVFPDWLPAMNMIESYNILYRIFVVEGKANRTRYIGEMTPSDIQKINLGDKAFAGAKDLMGDAYLNVGFNNDYSSSTQGAGLTISMGDPKLEAYTQALEWIKTQIFNAAGYTPFKISDTYENKTSSLLSNKLDKETTEHKQALRTEKWYRLFDSVLMFYGVNPFDESGQRKYSFDIVNAGITDATMEIQNDKELLEMGIMTRAEVRAKVFNEPMDLAEKNVADVDKQAKAQQELFNPQGNDSDENTTDADNDNQPDNQVDNKELLGAD